MDRTQALEHRVTVLEAEVAQLREFVNAFRSSTKLGPLEPVVVHGGRPAPTAVTPMTPAPAPVKGQGRGVWVFSGNATSYQMIHVWKWLDIPAKDQAHGPDNAAVIVMVVFSPGVRGDPDKPALAQFRAAGKTVYGLVLEAGQGNSVKIPDNLIPNDHQLTLSLDDDFEGFRDTAGNHEVARKKKTVFREVYASSSHVKDQVSLAGTGLRAVGARDKSMCVAGQCVSAALYQCDSCTGQQYCGEHTRYHAWHLNAGCPGRK